MDMSKKFWIEREMREHVQKFRTLTGRERDRYWQEHIHNPVNSCMNYAIPMIDSRLLNDQELRAELMLVILETLLTKIDFDSGRKVNILSYLVGTIKSKTLNYIAGASRQRGAALLSTHKIVRTRTERAENFSEIDIKVGDRISAQTGDKTWRITNFGTKFERFDDEKYDVIVEKFSTIDWANTPWGSLHAFVAKIETTERIKSIANTCFSELGNYLKEENRSLTKRDFFNNFMASRHPELRFARGEIALVQHTMINAYASYLRIEKSGGLWEEAFPTLCDIDY